MTIVVDDKGIDVSRYQTFSDYQAVANAGIKFAFIKATEGSAQGTAYVSPVMDDQYNGLKGVGIERGFYHFARYVSPTDALEEAKWFVQHIQNYDFTLPPCLDLEYNGCGSLTILAQATKVFLEYVEQQLGSVIIYVSKTYYGYVKDVITPYGIWLADPTTAINIDKTKDQLYAWQYDWHGKLAGIASEVDLDRACGSFFTTANKMAPAAPVKVAPVVEPTPAPVQAAPVQPAPVVVPETYTVHAGDTLSGIAAKFGISQDVVEKLNGITNPNFIQVGQVLRLKNAPAPAPKAPAPSLPTYTVRSGDTLSGIAARFGTTQAELQRLNGITNPNFIQVGQVLRLHASAPANLPVYHKVVSGDAVSKLAAKYGSTTAQIVAWNNLKNANTIFVGQVLRVK